jgi:hypothetical protein
MNGTTLQQRFGYGEGFSGSSRIVRKRGMSVRNPHGWVHGVPEKPSP